ncbi:hypothetical protein ACFL34_02955 [Candidatus Sumerlaeota bacterium]
MRIEPNTPETNMAKYDRAQPSDEKCIERTLPSVSMLDGLGDRGFCHRASTEAFRCM